MPYTWKKDKHAQWLRPLSYALMFFAGSVFMPSVAAEQIGIVWFIMSGFLAVGGFAAFVGAVRGVWIGEYTGLPLLFTSFLVFAILQGAMSLQGGFFWFAIGNSALLLAVSSAMAARWREVSLLRHAASLEANERRKGKPRVTGR